MDADADRARALHAESKRLEQFLLALPPEAWRQPSRCPRWQVADVIAHLIEDEYAERMARGLRGDLTPVGFAPDATLHGKALQAQITQHPVALRQRLGDALLSAFCAENDRVDRLLTDLSPPAWETLCYHPGRPRPLRALVDIRLLELAMHSWDIRAAFDPQVSLFDENLPGLLRLLPGLVRRAFRPDANRARPVRHRWRMGSPTPGDIDIVLHADGAAVEAAGDAAADVTLHSDAATAMLAICGRPPLMKAIADERIRVEGDKALAIAFAQQMQGG